MAQLHADAGIAVAVHEADDAGERVALFVIPEAGAARGDAAVRRNARDLAGVDPSGEGVGYAVRAEVVREVARRTVDPDDRIGIG